MRPNSKTYNTDFGSSFQRQPYRTFQSKPKAVAMDRWDHDGFDQLQLEQQDKSSKFPRYRKNQADNTMASDSLDTVGRGRGFNQDKARWTHDKFQETADDLSLQKNKEETEVKQVVAAQEPKTRKRPDRQLYSVRQKYSMKNEELKKATIPCSERLDLDTSHRKDEASPYLKGAKDLNGFDEKEMHCIEDDKLSISNVSTAMSDRLRNWEEESYLKSESLKDRVDTSDMIHSPKYKESSELAFEILLEADHGSNRVRIYHGEDDYEALLDNVCNKSNLDVRTALYFKINMMQLIVEAGVSTEKTSVILDKLLDTNYKVLMCESGLCEVDESIASYMMEKETRESESFLENLEDSY